MHSLSAQQTEKIITAIKNWSNTTQSVKAAAVVGSWSDADRAHAEADLDLVLVVDDPDRFRTDVAWMAEMDWQAAGLGQGHWSDCDYARACSRHLKFDDGTEVEVSFVPPDWARIDPLDNDTRRIAGNGMRVIHDPLGLLQRLLTMV